MSSTPLRYTIAIYFLWVLRLVAPSIQLRLPPHNSVLSFYTKYKRTARSLHPPKSGRINTLPPVPFLPNSISRKRCGIFSLLFLIWLSPQSSSTLSLLQLLGKKLKNTRLVNLDRLFVFFKKDLFYLIYFIFKVSNHCRLHGLMAMSEIRLLNTQSASECDQNLGLSIPDWFWKRLLGKTNWTFLFEI